MNKKNNFYITASIPYVNASPHMGHALEFVQADVIARYKKLLGKKTLYLSGSDENALKNVQAAETAGIPVKEFVDRNAKEFEHLAQKLNVDFDVFQKGSDEIRHFPSSQLLWKRCFDKDDIYKKEYQGLYCVGCETFYSDEELNSLGECFEHPGKKLDKVSETNYFFKLSRYQNALTDLLSSDKLKIYPEFRKKEMLSFLKEPLKDISISRSNQRAKNWGVPVPGDSTQRIYVWFDALNIYQTGVGFGWDQTKYNTWWPADVHVIGKGIIRFHAIYWPAFLLSAKLPLPKKLMVHGYITVNGQKMSKSIGNVINPLSVIEKYGADAVRYYLLKEIPTFSDGDFSQRRMLEIYNADLANELGNLITRITNLAQINNIVGEEINLKVRKEDRAFLNLIEDFKLSHAVEFIWEKIKKVNRTLDEKAPWKNRTNGNEFIVKMLQEVRYIGFLLQPFLPNTGKLILGVSAGPIKKTPPVFLKKP